MLSDYRDLESWRLVAIVVVLQATRPLAGKVAFKLCKGVACETARAPVLGSGDLCYVQDGERVHCREKLP